MSHRSRSHRSNDKKPNDTQSNDIRPRQQNYRKMFIQRNLSDYKNEPSTFDPSISDELYDNTPAGLFVKQQEQEAKKLQLAKQKQQELQQQQSQPKQSTTKKLNKTLPLTKQQQEHFDKLQLEAKQLKQTNKKKNNTQSTTKLVKLDDAVNEIDAKQIDTLIRQRQEIDDDVRVDASRYSTIDPRTAQKYTSVATKGQLIAQSLGTVEQNGNTRQTTEAWKFFRQETQSKTAKLDIFDERKNQYIQDQYQKELARLKAQKNVFQQNEDELHKEAMYNANNLWQTKGRKEFTTTQLTEELLSTVKDESTLKQVDLYHQRRQLLAEKVQYNKNDQQIPAKLHRKIMEIEKLIRQEAELEQQNSTIKRPNQLPKQSRYDSKTNVDPYAVVQLGSKENSISDDDDEDDNDDDEEEEDEEESSDDDNYNQQQSKQQPKQKQPQQQVQHDEIMDDYLMRDRDDEKKLTQTKQAQTELKINKRKLHQQYTQTTLTFMLDTFKRVHQSKKLVKDGQAPLHEYDHFVIKPLDLQALTDKFDSSPQIAEAFDWLLHKRGLIWDYRPTGEKGTKLTLEQQHQKVQESWREKQKNKKMNKMNKNKKDNNNNKDEDSIEQLTQRLVNSGKSTGYLALRPITNEDIAYMAQKRTQVSKLERVLEQENKYVEMQKNRTERKLRDKRLTKKTSTGQPVMKHRVKDLFKQVAKVYQR